MKKTYEKPVLRIEQFDMEDVITTSGLLTMVARTFEDVIDNFIEMYQSIGS